MSKHTIEINNQLHPSRWEEYRNFKLSRLKEDPHSSHVSFEEENSLKLELWEKDLEMALAKDKFIHTFALENNQIIGMGSIFLSSKIHTKHVASVVSIHVDKAHRKKGAGDLILKDLIQEAKNKSLTKLELTVNTQQLAAVNLYLKNGFVIVGKLSNTIKVENSFYDEYVMELSLTR